MLNKKGGIILNLIILIAVAALVFFLVKPTELLKKMRLAPPQKEIGAPEALTQVKVYKLAYAPFTDTLPVLGTIKGITQVEFRFEINGVVNAVNFKEGDFIEKGALVAALDQKDALLKLDYAKTKLKTAQAQADVAKKKLEMHQMLYDAGAIIKSKLEESALEYEVSKSQIESAQKEVDVGESELKKTFLYSPMDGVMGTRDIDPGEYITPQTKLGNMFDIKGVYVEAGVIEKDINKVKLGQKVKVTVDAYSGKEFEGEVDNIPSLVEAKARTLPCKVKLDNSDGLLKPGMFARCEICVFESENALMMPASGLFDSDGDGTADSAFVIDEENTAHMKHVEIGYLTTEKAEIKDGLSEGEIVVVETAKKLEDATKVEVIETVAGK